LASAVATREEVDAALVKILEYMRENMLASVSLISGHEGITARRVPLQRGTDVAAGRTRAAKHLA
jgi:hypothetical protein